MKIIQVIPAFRLAGAEVMCENLCVALKNAGENVIAVSLYSEDTAITDRLKKNGVRVEYLDKKLGFDASIIIKLIQLFKKERPDVVHTHIYASKYALPATVLAGVKKKVHTVHSMAQKEQGSLGKKINTFMYRHCGVVPVALSCEVKKTISDVYGLQGKLIRYCQELCANTTASLMKLVRRRPNRPRACSAWLPISGPSVVRQGWRSHLRSP